jgi:hypothetical protein
MVRFQPRGGRWQHESVEHNTYLWLRRQGEKIVFKKLVVILLLVVLSQATLNVYAGMHFPGTAAVDHSTFYGTATVEGFGGNTAYSIVNLHLFTQPGSGLTALCANPAGNIAPGQSLINVDVSQTSPDLHPDQNGNASFSFTVPLLPSTKAAGCPNGKWQVVGLKGTLFATYTANEYKTKDPGTLFALATLGFQCTIDESVNTHTTCVQIFETAQTF